MATKKEENFKLIHIVGFVVVVIGLMWVYGGNEAPGGKSAPETVEAFDWDSIAEARAAAVAYAGAAKLGISGLELVDSETDDGDSYRITYQKGGETFRLYADRICDRLDMEKLQRPGCWDWR